MQLPDTVKDIRAAYVSRFPIPTGAPGEAHEENVRQWSIRFAEQVAYSTDDPRWGMKRADGGRPISKDTIAYTKAGRLFIWDLLIGTGTGTPTLNDNPEGEEVPGQVFVPVEPVNHIRVAAPAPVPPTPAPLPPTPPDPVEDDEIDLGPLVVQLVLSTEKIDALLAQQQMLTDRIAALERAVNVVPTARPQGEHPAYVGRIPLGYFGSVPVRLTAEQTADMIGVPKA